MPDKFSFAEFNNIPDAMDLLCLESPETLIMSIISVIITNKNRILARN